ncbi:MAG: hypothetical protein ACREBS_05190 [Nitrososphaerales archaeon]
MKKGRLQIPIKVRRKATYNGFGVTAKIWNDALSIESASNIYDRLSFDVKFNFKRAWKNHYPVYEEQPRGRTAAR